MLRRAFLKLIGLAPVAGAGVTAVAKAEPRPIPADLIDEIDSLEPGQPVYCARGVAGVSATYTEDRGLAIRNTGYQDVRVRMAGFEGGHNMKPGDLFMVPFVKLEDLDRLEVEPVEPYGGATMFVTYDDGPED